MGDDWSNHQVFAGDTQPKVVHAHLLDAITTILLQQGYEPCAPVEITQDNVENRAHRVVAIGAAGRWISIYDSASIWYGEKPNLSSDLARVLSEDTEAVIGVSMSDSIVMYLNLFRDGVLADPYQTDKFMAPWKNEAERLAHSGHSELWESLLPDGTGPAELKRAWNEGRQPGMGRADAVFAAVSRVFGWDPALAGQAYMTAWDGVPGHAYAGVDLDEYHFKAT